MTYHRRYLDREAADSTDREPLDGFMADGGSRTKASGPINRSSGRDLRSRLSRAATGAFAVSL